MKNTIKLITVAALLMGFSSVSAAAWADSNTSEVRLIATIDNGPAFEPLEWKIFRVDDPSKTINVNRRHSFTLRSVEPGRYTAVVRKGNKTRKRDFYVMADTTSRVRVPFDD
ncbi:MAG: hypothetical protein R3F02_15450 [Thiolinea sp.]